MSVLNKLTKTTSLALIFFASNGCLAQERQRGHFLGSDIAKMCSSKTETDLIYCMGFIDGSISGTLAAVSVEVERTGKPVPLGHCIYGKTVDQATLRSLVISYVARNPAYASIDAAYAVMGSIKEGFPCTP